MDDLTKIIGIVVMGTLGLFVVYLVLAFLKWAGLCP